MALYVCCDKVPDNISGSSPELISLIQV